MTRQASKHASPGTRKSVLLLKKGGNVTSKEVKDLTGVPPSTQRRWVASAKASGDWDRLPSKPAHRKRRSDAGQGKKLTRRMIAAIKRRLLNNPSLTVDELRELVPGLSVVCRQWVNWVILHRIGLPSRVARKKPLLTDFQVERRKAWANKHKNWSKRKLSKILFSDEAHVEQWAGGAGVNRRVRRSSAMDAYQAKFLRPTMKHPAKLMVWGSIGNGKLGRLHILPRNTRMNSDLYQDVLRKHLRPSMTMTGTTIFQQDGAPCHTSRKMKDWFAQQDITLLDWPGQSPDMNPIENLWTAFKRLLRQKFRPPRNLAQLEFNMRRAWTILGRDETLLFNLCDSMERRIAALVAAEGGQTKY